jgi:hypothetical protein
MKRFEPSVCARLLSSLLLAAPSLGQGQFTVDDNGPADFASLQVAIDSVADGSVLLIQPGSYGIVTVTHPVVLLGRPNGHDRPKVAYLNAIGIDRVDVVSLDITGLILESLPGRSLVEDVRTYGGAYFTDVRELFVACCVFDHSGTSTPFLGMPGVSVDGTVSAPASRVQFVDCRLRGGRGTPFDLTDGDGGPGLRTLRAEVLLSGCTVQGGLGTAGVFSPGAPGIGVECQSGSLEIRGRSTDIVGGALQFLGGQWVQGAAVLTYAGAQVEYSNVTLQGAIPAWVTQVELRPWALWSSLPGGASFSLHGPSGDAALWVHSSASAYDPSVVTAFGLPLTLDLGAAFASGGLLLQGPDVAVPLVYPWPTNPALLGRKIFSQAAAISALDGTVRVTNGADLMLRL